MAFDDDAEDERPFRQPPLPPEDRLWRHPSEIGASLRSSSGDSATAGHHHQVEYRSPTVVALIGACFAGAAVALGAMWLVGATGVTDRQRPATAGVRVGRQAARFVDAMPTERLAREMAPSLAALRVERAGSWTTVTALWIDQQGTLAAPLAAVSGATQLLVVGDDGTARRARVVGSDPVTGVAALASGHTAGSPVAFAAAVARAGERAVVVGAPGRATGGTGSEATVASVVVRALGRRASVDDLLLHDALELDRAMPDDALGGALVDVDGAVLGMVVGNSAERRLGTVVPGANLRHVTLSLRDEGKVRRAWLGVRAVDLDPGQVSTLRIVGGARLTEVTPGSPAAVAGLRAGDTITALDGDPIEDASDLVRSLWAKVPGDRADIEVRRSGEDLHLAATLGG